MEMAKRNMVHVSFYYYEKTQFGFAQHKRSEKHMYLDEVLEIVSNKEAITNNRKLLSGLNGVLIEEWNGVNSVFQLCGWNGNVGMYCYLVDADNKLHLG